MQDPDTIDPVPMSNFALRKSRDYWLYWGNTVYHGGNEQQLHFSISTEKLRKGGSLGCCITRGGDLEIYINGQEGKVGWRNVPVNKPLWGVVEIYGKARTIQSEFCCGELYIILYNVYSVSYIYNIMCMCMHVLIHM